MTDTPWLDDLLSTGGGHIRQKNNTKGPQILLEKVGGLWFGLAINQKEQTSGGAHSDHKDIKQGMNCVIPYGT